MLPERCFLERILFGTIKSGENTEIQTDTCGYKEFTRINKVDLMIYNKLITFEYATTNMRIVNFFGCICAIECRV